MRDLLVIKACLEGDHGPPYLNSFPLAPGHEASGFYLFKFFSFILHTHQFPLCPLLPCPPLHTPIYPLPVYSSSTSIQKGTGLPRAWIKHGTLSKASGFALQNFWSTQGFANSGQKLTQEIRVAQCDEGHRSTDSRICYFRNWINPKKTRPRKAITEWLKPQSKKIKISKIYLGIWSFEGSKISLKQWRTKDHRICRKCQQNCHL